MITAFLKLKILVSGRAIIVPVTVTCSEMMVSILNTHFRMVNSPVQEVTLRCQASTMDAVIDRFGTKIPVQEIVADEWFETTVEVGTGLTFYNWIFGFGGKIRIMGPDSVKEEYRERLEMAYAALDEENDQ